MKHTTRKRKDLAKTLYSHNKGKHYVTGLGIASIFDISGTFFKPFERNTAFEFRPEFLRNAWLTVGDGIRAATEKAVSGMSEEEKSRPFVENR